MLCVSKREVDEVVAKTIVKSLLPVCARFESRVGGVQGWFNVAKFPAMAGPSTRSESNGIVIVSHGSCQIYTALPQNCKCGLDAPTIDTDISSNWTAFGENGGYHRVPSLMLKVLGGNSLRLEGNIIPGPMLCHMCPRYLSRAGHSVIVADLDFALLGDEPFVSVVKLSESAAGDMPCPMSRFERLY